MPPRAGWLHAAWLALGAALLSAGASSAHVSQNIDENLVNFIKHNLRRNNEDYNERLFTEDGTAPAPHTAAAQLAILGLSSAHGPAPTDRDAPSAKGEPRAAKRLQYFDRNDLLRLNEKRRNTKKVTTEEHGGVAAQPTPRRLRALFPSAATSRARPPGAKTSTTHVTKTAGDFKSVQRKRFASTTANKPVPGEAVRPRGPPRADILDLAPARGSRINAKRAKGRLCQRHVLLPEGPKYDSKGAVYLQPHGSRRPFPKTRAPRMLLPVCCNCCKKSVLGCE